MNKNNPQNRDKYSFNALLMSTNSPRSLSIDFSAYWHSLVKLKIAHVTVRLIINKTYIQLKP